MKNSSHNQINAYPTKSFFIDMLVKDIPLIDAIADLVDNSVDAALKLREDENLTGLKVDLCLNKETFSISDNCGGFTSEIARNYAFRFGRPEGAPDIPKSIGRFGVGMKRALFKLGNNIHISSKTSDSYFDVNIDINEWKNEPDVWSWEFDNLIEKTQEGEFGTTIIVKNIYPQVAEKFSQSTFIDTLIKEIRVSHEKVLEKGLVIVINGIQLAFTPSTLYVSDDIKPAYFKKELNGVDVEIIVGASQTGHPREAGWYIYCNGRLIVAANKTQLTGWGDGHALFHPNHAMFRGYVFFESNRSSLLPWNTTKNGVDEESEIFKAIRPLMIDMMKPVTNFLKKLKSNPYDGDDGTEGEEYETEKSLYDYVNDAQLLNISSINKNELPGRFKAPHVRVTRRTNTQKIQYNIPIEKVEKAKEVLQASSLKEVGEQTFEYFYRMECR
ncbi:ATP-binding protein [Priestia megaterium]|uniref:ATP-binding protein n=1 Tax=Priestia megaterium TaxID=1404 RepID=UPI0032559999